MKIFPQLKSLSFLFCVLILIRKKCYCACMTTIRWFLRELAVALTMLFLSNNEENAAVCVWTSFRQGNLFAVIAFSILFHSTESPSPSHSHTDSRSSTPSKYKPAWKYFGRGGGESDPAPSSTLPTGTGGGPVNVARGLHDTPNSASSSGAPIPVSASDGCGSSSNSSTEK